MAGKDKCIRILFTIPNFDTAGSGKVLYDLASDLDKSKFEVEIACNHNKGIFFQEVLKLGLPVHLLQFTVPYRPYFSLFFRLRPFVAFIKDNQYDVVHSWHWSSDWTEPLAARLAGVKWVYTKKAMSWGNVHWKIRSVLANFIVTINDEMTVFFSYKKNQRLIPLGIDLDFYKKHSVGLEERSAFRIVSIANLVPVKGIEVLIRAVHELKNSNIVLEVVGDDRDPYANQLKILVSELSPITKIIFMGKQADIRPVLESADLFVIPTLDEGRKEGMPMALVEAMCMEVPVLGSNISGIRYVLRDFPKLLVEPGNYQALAYKIKYIMDLSTASRGTLGNVLRNHCENYFSKEAFIQAHESLYAELTKRS